VTCRKGFAFWSCSNLFTRGLQVKRKKEECERRRREVPIKCKMGQGVQHRVRKCQDEEEVADEDA